VAGDLDAIFAYISKDSPHNASKFVARLLGAIEQLKNFPHRTIVEGEGSRSVMPVRSLPTEGYVVFFRVDDQQHVVRIVHVRHGARQRPHGFD
jgi:plasmid stabilization system protein ParE